MTVTSLRRKVCLREAARAVHEQMPVMRKLVSELVGSEIREIGEHARAVRERPHELGAIVEMRELRGLGIPGPGRD